MNKYRGDMLYAVSKYIESIGGRIDLSTKVDIVDDPHTEHRFKIVISCNGVKPDSEMDPDAGDLGH